jgi:hypothetical protein
MELDDTDRWSNASDKVRFFRIDLTMENDGSVFWDANDTGAPEV